MTDRSNENLMAAVFFIGQIGTFLYLTFFDGYVYTAWNWIIAIPINIVLSGIWPIYWAILHWIT